MGADVSIETVLKSVARSAYQNGLVLFLGAGVNGYLYRLWEPLVNALLREALSSHPDGEKYTKALAATPEANFDVYARATLSKTLLGQNYTEILRRLIYEPLCNENNHALFTDKDSNVDAVAAFCLDPAVKAVVTYNYDTHFEDAYKRITGKKRKIYSVGLSTRDRDPVNSNDSLSVFHVHGLLQSSRNLHNRRDDPVVLAYDEYSASMSDVCNWANATQTHFLRFRTCLFLGQSLTDWNVLRLLEGARLRSSGPCHWLFTCNKEFDRLGESADFHFKAKATLLDSVGVTLARMGNEFGDVYGCLKSLGNHLAKLHKDGKKRS
jgi:hypothetical protein